MFHNSRFLMLTTLVALMFGPGVRAQREQDQDNDRRPEARSTVTSVRAVEAPDLAKENMGRVAASSAQIQSVLSRDPGILVELKTWVAKEATNNGQVVDDSMLTDLAIFDRLEHDVEFRSVATRLVQKYGYLLPAINPDSEIAKQQDLILKERAHIQAQRQDQEQAALLAAAEAERKQETQPARMERTACDPQSQSNCRNFPASTGKGIGGSFQDDITVPDMAPPVFPDQTSPSGGQRAVRRSSADQSDSGFSNQDSGLTLASDTRRSGGSSGAGAGMGLGGNAQMGGMDIPDSMMRRGNLDELSAAGNRSDQVSASLKDVNRTVRLPGSRGPWGTDRDLPPVSMVHKVSPYADIPSLYDMYVQAASRDREPERFGVEMFRNGTRELDAIPMDLPVGPDYVVGPGDGLAINLWGGVSQRMIRVVDREGRVTLPEAGPVLVSGRTLGEVQESVQQVLRSQFRDVSADVSLSRLRTVRVYVVGEVAEPGAYDISSLSTPLNALFAAGGITQRGSLRNLKHYRGKQLIEEVDAYDLLLHGVGSDLKRLENGDSLLIPPLGGQVTVSGMVRRPAVYELRGENSLAEVLDLAGGILPAAALRHIEVQRLEAHEKRTMLTLDLSPEGTPDSVTKQLGSFKVQDGDQIHIFPIAPYNEQSIYLQGHVLRPGRYSYHDGMTLKDLIASYGDLLPEPAAHYGEIVRLNPPDFRPSVESFDLSAALANPATSPKLQPLDTVRIFSRFDFEPPPTVWVGGEVRAPGKYPTSGQVRLRDAVYLAGGVSTDAGLDTAQLFRTQTDGTLKIFSVNLGGALAGIATDNILLEPRDRVLIHRNSAQVDPATVYVKGEVAKPGRYPLTTNMHVEDLINVAGGLKRSADPVQADLTRYALGAQTGTSYQSLPVELSAALSGNATNNLQLRDGDVLTVRQTPGWNDIAASATVRGEVQHPGSYGIQPGERLSSVLERAGGFSPQAYPYGAVLMRREVRDVEMKSHIALVQRIKAEQVNLKALPETDADQRNAKLTAIAQTETTLTQLESTAPVGRLVVRVQPDISRWRNTAADVTLRDGDVLLIPKKENYVMVSGQVFNQTAISYRPGRSARWYLNQAGGLTQIADKSAVFVVRADGSVIAAKNNSGWWAGDPMSASLKPGDSIIVPEKTPRIGTRNWTTALQAAQIATSVALTIAYIKP